MTIKRIRAEIEPLGFELDRVLELIRRRRPAPAREISAVIHYPAMSPRGLLVLASCTAPPMLAQVPLRFSVKDTSASVALRFEVR